MEKVQAFTANEMVYTLQVFNGQPDYDCVLIPLTVGKCTYKIKPQKNLSTLAYFCGIWYKGFLIKFSS